MRLSGNLYACIHLHYFSFAIPSNRSLICQASHFFSFRLLVVSLWSNNSGKFAMKIYDSKKIPELSLGGTMLGFEEF